MANKPSVPPTSPQPQTPLPMPPPPMLSNAFTTKLSKSGHKTLTAAANLTNLLPTGTVLAFLALLPSFSNNGTCTLAIKYLTLSLIVVCSIACFLSSFTDSFMGNDGKLYYGIATFTTFYKHGFYVFNDNKDDKFDVEKNQDDKNMLRGYKITLIDFVHAFASLVVFLVFSISSSDVQSCFFNKFGENENN